MAYTNAKHFAQTVSLHTGVGLAVCFFVGYDWGNDILRRCYDSLTVCGIVCSVSEDWFFSQHKAVTRVNKLLETEHGICMSVNSRCIVFSRCTVACILL